MRISSKHIYQVSRSCIKPGLPLTGVAPTLSPLLVLNQPIQRLLFRDTKIDWYIFFQVEVLLPLHSIPGSSPLSSFRSKATPHLQALVVLPPAKRNASNTLPQGTPCRRLPDRLSLPTQWQRQLFQNARPLLAFYQPGLSNVPGRTARRHGPNYFLSLCHGLEDDG